MYMTDRLYNKGKDRNNTLTTTEGIPKGDWLYNQATRNRGGQKTQVGTPKNATQKNAKKRKKTQKNAKKRKFSQISM